MVVPRLKSNADSTRRGQLENYEGNGRHTVGVTRGTWRYTAEVTRKQRRYMVRVTREPRRYTTDLTRRPRRISLADHGSTNLRTTYHDPTTMTQWQRGCWAATTAHAKTRKMIWDCKSVIAVVCDDEEKTTMEEPWCVAIKVLFLVGAREEVRVSSVGGTGGVCH